MGGISYAAAFFFGAVNKFCISLEKYSQMMYNHLMIMQKIHFGMVG